MTLSIVNGVQFQFLKKVYLLVGESRHSVLLEWILSLKKTKALAKSHYLIYSTLRIYMAGGRTFLIFR